MSFSSCGLGTKASTGAFLTLISAAAFALNTPLAPFFYEDGGNPATLSLMRSAAAAFVAFIFMMMLREKPSLPKKDGPLFLLMALSLFGQGFCYLSSVKYISVSLAALLFYSWPLVVAIAAPLLIGKRPSLLHMICFLLAFVGLGVALGPNLDQLDWRGIAFALVGGSLIATYILTVGHLLSRGQNPVNIAFMANFLTILIAGAFIPFMGGLVLPPLSSAGAWALLGVCIVYALGVFTQLLALERIPAPMVAMIYNAEPVISIAVAAMLLGEILGMQEISGGALVIGALVAYSALEMRKR